MTDHSTMCMRTQALLPGWRSRAAATERANSLSMETVDELHNAGLLRIIAPKQYGGLELSWPTIVETSRIAARACASTGWMISLVGGHIATVGRLSKYCQDIVFSSAPRLVIATASAPTSGKISKVEGGFYLNGTWRFASGVDHANWVIVAGSLLGSSTGSLQGVVKIIVPADRVEVSDTWRVTGMRGTGSKDICFTNQFVADEWGIDKSVCLGAHPPGAETNPGAYLYDMPLLPYSTTWVIGPILGSAEGAWDEYVAATRQRISAMPVTMRADLSLLQDRLAESAAELACARHLYQSISITLHEAGLERRVLSSAQVSVVKRDCAYLVQLCLRAVQRLVQQLGTTAVSDTNHIQRQWRDLQVMASHIDINRDKAMAAYACHVLGMS